MARTNPLSAAFWADADQKEPGSYSSLEARRKIAEQLAKKSPFPTTLGQGLTYLGESLVERARMNELADAERASDTYADKRLNEIHSTPGGYVPPAEGTTTAPAPERRAEGSAPPAVSQEPQELPPPPMPAVADVGNVSQPPRTPANRNAIADALLQRGLPTQTLPFAPPPGSFSPEYQTLPFTTPAGLSPDQPAPAPMAQQPLPPLPNALIAALRTKPVAGPDSPANWGGGKLTEVPTDLSNVEPGTFGLEKPPIASSDYDVNVGRGDEMKVEGGPGPQSALPPRTRIAALGGVPAPNTAAAAADNSAIASDITPMPRQAAADLPPPATGPAVPSSRIAQAPEIAPGIPPSRLPIPPDIPQEMKHPGPEPVQPRPLGPSQVQQKMESIFNDRRLAPDVREAARQRYNAEEGYRKELEANRNNKYTNDRAQWNQDVRAHEKFKREANDRDIDRRIKLQGIEKTNSDLEEAYYKRGIPREQAKAQADLDIANARRRLTQPDTVAVGGTHLERQRDEQGRPVGGYAVPQGLPPVEEKPLTEMQGKADVFTKRALPEVQQLKSTGNGKALTYFKDDVLAARLPAGMDNRFVSEQYQKDRNAMTNFGTALMTYLSGASYGEKEMERTLSAYWPKYGDSDAEIERKAVRREGIVAAVSRMTDKTGREYVAKSNFDYEATQPAVRVTSPDEAKKLGPGRHFITHDGRPMQVPFEDIRTR